MVYISLNTLLNLQRIYVGLFLKAAYRFFFLLSAFLSFGWLTIAAILIFIVRVIVQNLQWENVALVEQKRLKVVPKVLKVDVYHWLILLGRYTCVARKPQCGSCIIEDLCEYSEKVG